MAGGALSRPDVGDSAWPQYEAIVTEAIRAVQTRRLAPSEALQFVTTRVRQELRHQVRIVD